MADSLAFWIEESDESALESKGKVNRIELHFKYWSIMPESVNYLDIGVRIKSMTDFKSINFYLPFKRKNIEYDSGLGAAVCKDTELISSIFNKDIDTVSPYDNVGMFDIKFRGGENLLFYTYINEDRHDSHGGAKLSDCGESGCTISFPYRLFSQKSSRGDKYFRFRIKVKGKENISRISRNYEPKDYSITNYFENTEMVDFRVNELRNIPSLIRQNLNFPSYIDAIHFFLVREASNEYKISHDKYHRCRILEEELWHNYLFGDSAKEDKNRQLLIYHWKQKYSQIDQFSAFSKFSSRKVRKRQIALVLGVIFVMGVLSGISANKIFSMFSVNDFVDNILSLLTSDMQK